MCYFTFFFKQLIRIITCINTVCWVLSLLHCLLRGLSWWTHGRESCLKAAVGSTNFFFLQNQMFVSAAAAQPKIQLIYKAAVCEGEQTTHIWNNKGKNSALCYCSFLSLTNSWIWHIYTEVLFLAVYFIFSQLPVCCPGLFLLR